MTTTVTVKAHCDPSTTKVRIETIDLNNPQPVEFIEDGEEKDVVVFDDRQIIIGEVAK